MPEGWSVEVAVTREERGPRKMVEQWDYLGVLEAASPEILADLARMNAPVRQLAALVLLNVLIENVHTVARAGTLF